MANAASGSKGTFAGKHQSTILGHPAGLFVLFFTEMWERFSYYGMRALLVPYMLNYFKWTQAEASNRYKWYTSLVYLTPLLGGYLADRYLGNKRAIIIGASLMAIGHFCMAFEQIEIFYAALVFLIFGNGFFKPNMSTQVGRLYPANDPRRDSAYTIFYMGINLGAFLSPLLCGWLKDNTSWSYHAGFTAAGVGMVLSMIIYLVGVKWVNEIPEGVQADEKGKGKGTHGGDEHYVSEAEAATTPPAAPLLSRLAPSLFTIVGVLALGAFAAASIVHGTGMTGGLAAPVAALIDRLGFDSIVAFGLGGGLSALLGAWVASKVSMALRDRVVVIYLVGIFVVCFWAGFEQSGNSMNVHADKTTNRYLTKPAPPPSIYPENPEEAAAAGGQKDLLNPVSTEWFQSINALAIFMLAPLFAWLWVKLPRMGINLSIPAKISIGVFFVGLAFALMTWSVQYENQPSSAPLEALPSGVTVDERDGLEFRDAPDLGDDEGFAKFKSGAPIGEKRHVINGGRLVFKEAEKTLHMMGVLADTDRDRILRATVSPAFLHSVRELAKKAQEAKAKSETVAASVTLSETPPGLDLRYAGFSAAKLKFNPETRELTTTVTLADKDYKAILVAGSNAPFREALNKLYIDSAKFKLSWQWLFWFYILCTLGELCLSPVGLSMVSKLAPVKFGTMLMGVWLLTSFFGNFIAGWAGEKYGTAHPQDFFVYFAVSMAGASLVCFVVVKKLKAMMHGVN